MAPRCTVESTLRNRDWAPFENEDCFSHALAAHSKEYNRRRRECNSAVGEMYNPAVGGMYNPAEGGIYNPAEGGIYNPAEGGIYIIPLKGNI